MFESQLRPALLNTIAICCDYKLFTSRGLRSHYNRDHFQTCFLPITLIKLIIIIVPPQMSHRLLSQNAFNNPSVIVHVQSHTQ